MTSESGVRVRLDLSNVETNVKKQFRWVYLSHESFSTIKDVKKYIRSCLTEQSDGAPQIRLYLEEPFWLPASESARILQNGDLIVVKNRPDDADDEPMTSHKRRCSVTTSTERRSKVDSDVSQNSNLPKKRRLESMLTTAAKVEKGKTAERGKNKILFLVKMKFTVGKPLLGLTSHYAASFCVAASGEG